MVNRFAYMDLNDRSRKLVDLAELWENHDREAYHGNEQSAVLADETAADLSVQILLTGRPSIQAALAACPSAILRQQVYRVRGPVFLARAERGDT